MSGPIPEDPFTTGFGKTFSVDTLVLKGDKDRFRTLINFFKSEEQKTNSLIKKDTLYKNYGILIDLKSLNSKHSIDGRRGFLILDRFGNLTTLMVIIL